MMISPLATKKMSGEYWDYTTTIDAINGQVDTYFKVGDITFYAVVAEKGIMYMYVSEQLKYNAQIRNIRDTSGRLLFTDDPTALNTAYVGVGEPVLNMWGEREGFRHDLKEGLA